MSITISFALQKGGVGKTTTTAITSWLMAARYKVLAVDFDQQGNLTRFLSRKSLKHFEGRTVFEAIQLGDIRPFIHPVKERLDLLPADTMLANLRKYLETEYEGKKGWALADLLDQVYDDYDFILIDLPPNLENQTLGIVASNYVVAVMKAAPLALEALPKFVSAVRSYQERVRNDLVFLGILSTMVDKRTITCQEILNKIQEAYGDLVFETFIERKQRLEDFSLSGIEIRTKEDVIALEGYKNFVKEMIRRVTKQEGSRQLARRSV